MVGETASGTLCSTCAADFPSNALRREHMHSEWHVYNMKRRITELPPISLDTYENLIRQQSHTIARHQSRNKDREEDGSTSNQQTTREDQRQSHFEVPECCLFCDAVFEDLDANLRHMASQHGFRIPNEDALQTDVETLLTYISLVIEEYHSCIYCGQERSSKMAAQAHMRAKGHCMLDLSPSSEFLEFWEPDPGGDDDAGEGISAAMVSDNEMRLPSGVIASSRQDGRPGIKPARHHSTRDPRDETALVPQTTTTQEPPSPHTNNNTRSSSTALAPRDAMGLTGLSDLQRSSLAIVQKKAKAREQRSRNEARWVLEKFNNRTKQKHFKPDVPGRKNG